MIEKDVPRTYGGICTTWWDQMRHELEKTARLASLERVLACAAQLAGYSQVRGSE